MSRCLIYLDESGDLGFNFAAPYRNGGSSRHITLAAAVCEEDSNKYIKRFIVDFYSARGIAAGKELKWSALSVDDRTDFATRAAKLARTHRAIRFASITVFKQNVMPHIQEDPNKLYNYMTGLMLLKMMREYDDVCFIPDSRAIKVKSGNSLHDYLQTKLWFDEGVATKLETQPSDSSKSRPLHFTDYLCGTFQAFHEDGQRGARDLLYPLTQTRNLFFP